MRKNPYRIHISFLKPEEEDAMELSLNLISIKELDYSKPSLSHDNYKIDKAP